MAEKRGLGFWIGVVLILLVVLKYIPIPFVSSFLTAFLPIVTALAGVYLILKG
ncbi:MAG: hypothetical protein KJ601_00615 [Nanoarchaeota archaeon]|nr:hypothetical protein [Nanoarchaeota archaeon]MBU1704053.1 hypothetical protein [Nanoarchaeota archaeon]